MSTSVSARRLDELEAKLALSDDPDSQDLRMIVRDLRRARAKLAEVPLAVTTPASFANLPNKRNRFFRRNPEFIPFAGRQLSMDGRVGRIVEVKRLPHEAV